MCVCSCMLTIINMSVRVLMIENPLYPCLLTDLHFYITMATNGVVQSEENISNTKGMPRCYY